MSRSGETLGLLRESGSGKSTLARAVTDPPDTGRSRGFVHVRLYRDGNSRAFCHSSLRTQLGWRQGIVLEGAGGVAFQRKGTIAVERPPAYRVSAAVKPSLNPVNVLHHHTGHPATTVCEFGISGCMSPI
jgi:energy-coupling factor transporter ATP-binding protein EcfA2